MAQGSRESAQAHESLSGRAGLDSILLLDATRLKPTFNQHARSSSNINNRRLKYESNICMCTYW